MNDYSEDLMKSVANSEIGQLAEDYSVDSLDSAIDQLLNNEVTDHIPIVKTIVGVSKGIVTIRDRNYLRKIFKFLFQTNQVSDEAKAKFAEKLSANDEEVKKAGEAVWEILDSVSSSEKAPMIGKVFEAYMSEEIGVGEVVHLSEMIDKAYLIDLQNLEEGKDPNYYNLVNVGIMKAVPAEEIMKHVQENMDRNLGFQLSGMSPSPPPQLTNRAGLTDTGAKLVRILRTY